MAIWSFQIWLLANFIDFSYFFYFEFLKQKLNMEPAELVKFFPATCPWNTQKGKS